MEGRQGKRGLIKLTENRRKHRGSNSWFLKPIPNFTENGPEINSGFIHIAFDKLLYIQRLFISFTAA